MSLTPTRHATVATVVITDGAGGLGDTLSAVGRQVYETAGAVLVGGKPEGELASELPWFAATDDAIAAIGTSVEFIWFLREGAVPAPDALVSLVNDAIRTDSGIVGSKIVGSDRGLVSVGLVTDVFGVPYTGLDRSEKDQGQHDVVRDIAAVAGVSMLVRRDLLAGVGGIDASMAPVAASIDLSQRARLKGARTIVSPASEVTYDRRDERANRWREEASRIRAYVKVYGWLTLAWVLPFDFFIGLVEWVVSLFLGRWYGFDWARSWVWNLRHAPSTISQRRHARTQRTASDEELFRFQRRGSVKISRVWAASLAALRRRLPGDESLTVESIGADIRQPAFVVGAVAVLLVMLSARNIWADGFPAVGYTLPVPSNGWHVLDAYAGGWNPAGLGSTLALRPLLAVAAIVRILTLHTGHVAEYVLAAGAMLSGIWGMTRLLRTWSVGAAPALVAGIVYVAGPTAQGIAGNTHIGTVLALGVLPWALRFCLAPVRDQALPAFARMAGAVLVFGLMGALSPVTLLVPLPALVVYAALRFADTDAWRAVLAATVGTAGGALLLSPWIWDHSFEAIVKDGYAFWATSPVMPVAGAVVAVVGVVAAERRVAIIAGWAALLAAFGYLAARGGSYGLGSEAESVGLAVAGLGVGICVGVVAATVSNHEAPRWRRSIAGFGVAGIALLLISASTIVLGGRLGLPGDVFSDTLTFTRANEGEAARSRVLLVGPADQMPGDSRLVEGGAYRVVSAPVPDLGEARLAPRGDLDEALLASLHTAVDGETRRIGGLLAPFGIRWIVVLGDSDGADADPTSLAWRQVFAGQLDLLPLSAGVSNAVFVTAIDPVSRALTSTAQTWPRTGWSYAGDREATSRVFVAENPDPGFGPGPWLETASANEVSAAQGVVTFSADGPKRLQALVVLLAVVSLLGFVMVSRRMR